MPPLSVSDFLCLYAFCFSADNFSMEKRSGVNFFLCFVLGLAAALFCKVFILDVYRVSGSSMEECLENGQVIFVNKLAYGLQNPFKPELLFCWRKPRKNDVVIYMYRNSWVVKRCVAVEGDPLEYSSNSEYNLLVGKRKIALNSIQYHRMKSSLAVPHGYVLAVGDNYERSYDSRDYGFVPQKNILAQVFCK